MPLFYIIFIWAISYGLFIFRKQKMRNSTPPTHVINLSDQIYAFEISGSEWTTNLLCIAVTKKIILGIVKFPVSIKFLESKIQFSINFVIGRIRNRTIRVASTQRTLPRIPLPCNHIRPRDIIGSSP